jgi:hypothetical protein
MNGSSGDVDENAIDGPMVASKTAVAGCVGCPRKMPSAITLAGQRFGDMPCLLRARRRTVEPSIDRREAQ